MKDAGNQRVSTSAAETGSGTVSHERLARDLVITETGYVYIYLSNEGTDPVDVFFDDFGVEHVKGPVVQMEDYYPFGLTFNEYRRENGLKNQYLYNGKERIDALGLNLYDYGARMYMPDLGRWGGIDPLTEKGRRWSSYNYAFDNPISFIDKDGMWPGPGIPSTLDFLTGAFNAIVTNHHPTQAGRGMGRETAVSQESYDAGQQAGDVVSLALGAVDIYIGAQGAAVGIVAAPETGGASLIVSAAGVATMAEGALVLKNAYNGVLNSTGKISEKQLKDLKPTHSRELTENTKSGKEIQNLSDEELVNSANNPKDGDHIKENTRTGKLVNGNTRVNELQKRAADSSNKNITPETRVKVEQHIPEFDAGDYWDLIN